MTELCTGGPLNGRNSKASFKKGEGNPGPTRQDLKLARETEMEVHRSHGIYRATSFMHPYAYGTADVRSVCYCGVQIVEQHAQVKRCWFYMFLVWRSGSTDRGGNLYNLPLRSQNWHDESGRHAIPAVVDVRNQSLNRNQERSHTGFKRPRCLHQLSTKLQIHSEPHLPSEPPGDSAWRYYC